MGELIKSSIVTGHALGAKKVALDWVTLCAVDTQKAIFGAVDAAFELAGISGCIVAEDMQRDPGPFLEQLPEWVRDRNLDLMSYSFSTMSGRPGKRSVLYWERFWNIGLGTQNVGDILDFKLPDLLDQWFIPMSQHGIRTVRHVATVAALAISQALGHHMREMTRQCDTNRKQLEVAFPNEGQASRLEREIELLEERIKLVGAHRNRLLENTVPHRNRDICEIIRLHTLTEVSRLMKAEPAQYLQQKWTARVFLMIHDQSVDVRLKALACISSWFEKHSSHKEDIKDHILQFAERCMAHIVDRTRDVDSRVSCMAIKMLRQPVLAERMTDEEVERIVNLVSMGKDLDVRQEAALFVNAQVFQDPGIVVPERPARKKRRARDLARDPSEDPDGDPEANLDEPREEREGQDGIAHLLNSETSISMFIEFLENYMGQNLRVTDRAVNAFWSKSPCLSHWHTMVSLVILGEDNVGPASDPVSTRQRLILLHVMEACVRRALEDWKVTREAGGRTKKEETRMEAACTTIVPELPRLFELCRSEENQVLIVSHICKMLIEFSESTSRSNIVQAARPVVPLLRQCILNRGLLDITRHCTDSLLVITLFQSEVRGQFIELSKQIHDDTMKAGSQMFEGAEPEEPDAPQNAADELRTLLGKFSVINQRGIDMSFGNVECVLLFFRLLDARIEGMRKWRDHCKEKGVENQDFQFPARMPDTAHVILVLENCAVILGWYFRFCIWEHHTPGSAAMAELASTQAAKVKATRDVLPKVFKRFRDQLCELIEMDGSPHVKLTAFSSYMTVMQVAVGVSEGIDVEGGDATLPGGRQIQNPEDLDEVRMPSISIEHMKKLWYYLNEQFTQVQGSHAVRFDEDGQRVEPHDIWPPLSFDGSITSYKVMIQELLEQKIEISRANNFEAEDGDQTDQRRLLRAIFAARMVLESEVEDIHAGPLGQLVLTQLDRSKPKPLRDLAMRLKRTLREHAQKSTYHCEQYFETQKVAVISLFDNVGVQSARSMAAEFARQWGPHLPHWLHVPLFNTLMSAIEEAAKRGEKGLQLLDAFSFWIKGDEAIQEAKRTKLAERIRELFEPQGVDSSGIPRFSSQRDAEPAADPAAGGEAEDPAEVSAPTPIGKRIRGKQSEASIRAAMETDENEPPAENTEDMASSRKKPRQSLVVD